MDKLRFVQTELAKLMNHYRFTSVDPNPRVKRSICPKGIDCIDENCECNGSGMIEVRADWVNAECVWKATVHNLHVAYMVMLWVFPQLFDGDAPWFGVYVYEGTELKRTDNLHVANKLLASATTTSWDGERAGSAIPNPSGLTGPMYRLGKPDSYIRPDDIVAYLLNTL